LAFINKKYAFTSKLARLAFVVSIDLSKFKNFLNFIKKKCIVDMEILF